MFIHTCNVFFYIYRYILLHPSSIVPTISVRLGTKHQGPRASATILAPAAAGVLCGAPGVVVGLAVGTTAYGAPWRGGRVLRLSVKDDVHIHVASRLQPPAPHRWAHTAEIYLYIYI